MAQDFNLKGTIFPSFRIGGTTGPVIYQNFNDPVTYFQTAGLGLGTSVKPGDLYLRINAGNLSGIYSYSGAGSNDGSWTNLTANSGSASIGGLTPTQNGFVVGNGTSFSVLEGVASPQGTDARSALGLSTSSAVQFGSYLSGNSAVSMFADAGTNSITIGSSTSTLVIPGDLIVNGSSTIVNSGTLEVADKNIILNAGGATATATLSGIEIQGDSDNIVGYMRSASINSNLEFKAPAGAILTLAMATNSQIGINTPAIGQTLRFDGTQFGNAALSLSDLSNVVITSPTNNQSLVYNGTNSTWVNQTIIDSNNNLTGAGIIVGTNKNTSKEFVLYNSTYDATPTELFLDGSSLTLNMNDNTTWLFELRVSARRSDTDGTVGPYESNAFWVDGLLSRQVGASTVSLVGTTNGTSIQQSMAWTVVPTADTTNGGIKVTVTGEVSKSINWTGLIRIVETSD